MAKTTVKNTSILTDEEKYLLVELMQKSGAYERQVYYSEELRDFILRFTTVIGSISEQKWQEISRHWENRMNGISSYSDIRDGSLAVYEKARCTLERLCDIYHRTYYVREKV